MFSTNSLPTSTIDWLCDVKMIHMLRFDKLMCNKNKFQHDRELIYMKWAKQRYALVARGLRVDQCFCKIENQTSTEM